MSQVMLRRAASSLACYFPMDVAMRATPALSTISGFSVTVAGGGATAVSVSVSSIIGGNQLRIDFSGAAGLVAGNATIMQAGSNPFLSAELTYA